MKPILIISIILFLVNLIIVKSQEVQNSIFILIPKTNKVGSKISFKEHKRGVSIGAYITFEKPNYSVRVTHMPLWVDYPSKDNREEIEISPYDLINSKVLFAEKLNFMEWRELEQIGLNQKIYMIFEEDYLSKDRFVLDHKFKALEVRVTADGPI
jgi:hypothetical protein